MGAMEAFATKIPQDLKKALDEICKRYGLRKNFIIESALREKIEDILDTHDLDDAVRGATGFVSWKNAKKEIRGK